MKKFIFTMTIMFGIIASSILSMTKAEAAEYYLGDYSNCSFYLLGESINIHNDTNGFDCITAAVKNGSILLYVGFSFRMSNNGIYVTMSSNVDNRTKQGVIYPTNNNGWPLAWQAWYYSMQIISAAAGRR